MNSNLMFYGSNRPRGEILYWEKKYIITAYRCHRPSCTLALSDMHLILEGRSDLERNLQTLCE